VDIDRSPRANPARVRTYWLGGKDHYPADREAADRITAVAPWAAAAARSTRAFVHRAVTAMAREGITQYLDLGCGLPTTTALHDVFRRVAPDSRVVYADDDELVLAHVRAIHGTEPGVHVLQADLTRPAAVLDERQLHAVVDLCRPVGVVLSIVLDRVMDDGVVADAMARIRDVLAPGSCLAIAHATAPDVDSSEGRTHTAAATREAARLYTELVAPLRVRTQVEITRLFDGLTLLEPGLTDVDSWRRLPGGARPALPVLAGVGRVETR
jgi:SAM-dependent methyltransferase